jgi:hypothetical protein
MPQNPDGAGRTILVGAAVAILTLCAFQTVWAFRTREALERVEASATKFDAAAGQLSAMEETLSKLEAEQGLVEDELTRLARKVDGVVTALEGRGGPQAQEEPEPPQIDWTQPQLFAAAQKSCAEYGIELTKDEVRVPARFVVREGAIEYFAVLKGGKEHETLISLRGNLAADARRPRDFGARLNNAVQAIGFKRGKAVKYLPTGRVPPEGDTAYLFVEWQEKGETVVARAEDLVWDRIDEKPMERGKWIYVGSALVRGEEPNMPVFAADVEGEAVATYNSPYTIFDNSSRYGDDDTVYLSATPRIPKDVEACTFVIRRVDREPTRTFPDAPKQGGDESPKQGGDEKPAGGADGQGR